MLEVHLGGVEGIRFRRSAMRLASAVAEGGRSEAWQAVGRRIVRRRFAVELHEFDDLDAGAAARSGVALSRTEQVFDLGGFGGGLGL